MKCLLKLVSNDQETPNSAEMARIHVNIPPQSYAYCTGDNLKQIIMMYPFTIHERIITMNIHVYTISCCETEFSEVKNLKSPKIVRSERDYTSCIWSSRLWATRLCTVQIARQCIEYLPRGSPITGTISC